MMLFEVRCMVDLIYVLFTSTQNLKTGTMVWTHLKSVHKFCHALKMVVALTDS